MTGVAFVMNMTGVHRKSIWTVNPGFVMRLTQPHHKSQLTPGGSLENHTQNLAPGLAQVRICDEAESASSQIQG